MSLLRRNRVLVAVAVGIFLAGTLAGAGLVLTAPESAPSGGSPTDGDLSLPSDRALTFTGVFGQNAGVAAVLAAGVVTFGITSIYVLFYNGVLFGAGVVGGVQNTSVLVVASAVLPHAVLELPGFWLAAVVGLKPLHELARYLREKQDAVVRDRSLRDALYLLAWSFALLLVAAWVEATVTPAVIKVVR